MRSDIMLLAGRTHWVVPVWKSVGFNRKSVGLLVGDTMGVGFVGLLVVP